jgi:NADPH:quinone reductase-like Zn-dependent oxidoreductase
VLTPDGVLAFNAGGSPGKVIGAVGWMLRVAVLNLVVAQRLRTIPTNPGRADLVALTELVNAGSLRPVVQQVLDLADVPQALLRLEQGHARGKSVVRILATP